MREMKTWDNMSLEEWKLWAKVLKKYMPQVRMLDSIIQYLNDFDRIPTSKQIGTLQRLWNTSSGKKQYIKDMGQQETLEWSKKMTNKLMSSSQSKHVHEVDTSKYHDFLIGERPQIGFKQKSTLQKPHNRYTMDTSIENVKRTRLEEFDRIFNG